MSILKLIKVFIYLLTLFPLSSIAQIDEFTNRADSTFFAFSIENNKEFYKVTLNEDFITDAKLQKRYYPELIFDRLFTKNALNFVTQYYTLANTPFDSVLTSNIYIEEQTKTYSIRYNQEILDILNSEYKEEIQQNPNIITVRRCDFWNEVFEFNKEIANPEGFALIERAIKEAHHALGLDWNDTIFIGKETLSRHKAAVWDIFENMREEINPVYLK